MISYFLIAVMLHFTKYEIEKTQSVHFYKKKGFNVKNERFMRLLGDFKTEYSEDGC